MSLPADDEFETTDQADLENGVAEGEQALAAMAEGRIPAHAVEEAAHLRGEGEAAEGQVRVAARVGGLVEKLEIDPRAMRGGPDKLGEELTDALNQALDQVRERADGSAQDLAVQTEGVGEELEYAEELAMSRLGELSESLDDTIVRIERFAEED